MTDLALRDRSEPGAPPRFDIAIDGADLATDGGLQTAVTMSLFTDRRAEPDDDIPDGSDDRRGFWGDAWPDVEGDQWGSRLWLLSREKDLARVYQLAQQYAEEALAWMIEDGVARAVRVTTERLRSGVMGIPVEIEKPNGERYADVWSYTLEAVA